MDNSMCNPYIYCRQDRILEAPACPFEKSLVLLLYGRCGVWMEAMILEASAADDFD